MAEREAREVLKGYPKQPIASYILAESLSHQRRWNEMASYWEAATALPGPAGQEARRVCHNQYLDRKEFQTPPQKSQELRLGPITQYVFGP